MNQVWLPLECNEPDLRLWSLNVIALLHSENEQMMTLQSYVSTVRLKYSATFSKRPLKFTMYFRPLVKRPQRISTEKMFFFKNGMVGSSR